MKKILINGGKNLSGIIDISGAKNSVVALIPAAIMTSEIVEISNVPKLSDTKNLEKIISLLGGKIHFEKSKLVIDSSNLINTVIPEDLSNSLRASYYFMGALLGRFKHVEIFFPGGCQIGARPIDIHLEGFKKLGATITYENNKYTIDADKLVGCEIEFPFPSVGATVNLILASVLAEGTTILKNVAKEPEIANLIDLLIGMGANIKGKGTNELIIIEVKSLHSGRITTISDRIEAGTYMMIGALIGDDLKVDNIFPEHLTSLLEKFNLMGVNYKLNDTSIILNKTVNLKPVNIVTDVYPGFPTDLGQPFSVLLTMAKGTSKFKETIYENRVGQLSELIKMGANIKYTNSEFLTTGPTKYFGAEVAATDLRAGAALIVAGLCAKGTTKISNIEYILRGYEDIVEKLVNVGADIKIIEESI